jgi:hypothetical protein
VRQNSEITRIYRGFRRRVNNGKPLDSFPFLSGDSYFYSCEYFFESGNLQKVPSRSGRVQKNLSLFVKVSKIDEFCSFLNLNPRLDFTRHVLVLHNGDESINSESLEILNSRFKKVFAVNLLLGNESTISIPIGLENKSLFTNGIPKDFRKLISLGLKASESRSNLLLQAFSLHTNRGERESCRAVASRMGSIELNNASSFEYRRALANSKFVLSPAGNGFDCHRTWEAMYLGAIPIVRKIHWPFNDKNLPVLIVDDWEDLLDMDLATLQINQNSTWSVDFWDSFFNE